MLHSDEQETSTSLQGRSDFKVRKHHKLPQKKCSNTKKEGWILVFPWACVGIHAGHHAIYTRSAPANLEAGHWGAYAKIDLTRLKLGGMDKALRDVVFRSTYVFTHIYIYTHVHTYIHIYVCI